jgi:hypothetical protein
MSELNFDQIKISIANILRDNPSLDRLGIHTFSRLVPSFYTLLCKEVYGIYENYGPNYNRAVQLHRKITANSSFVRRILDLDLNQLENPSEIDYDFSFVSYSTERNKDNTGASKNEIKVIK